MSRFSFKKNHLMLRTRSMNQREQSTDTNIMMKKVLELFAENVKEPS